MSGTVARRTFACDPRIAITVIEFMRKARIDCEDVGSRSVRLCRYCVDDFACPLNTESMAACAHFSPSPLDTPIAPMT